MKRQRRRRSSSREQFLRRRLMLNRNGNLQTFGFPWSSGSIGRFSAPFSVHTA